MGELTSLVSGTAGCGNARCDGVSDCDLVGGLALAGSVGNAAAGERDGGDEAGDLTTEELVLCLVLRSRKGRATNRACWEVSSGLGRDKGGSRNNGSECELHVGASLGYEGVDVLKA